MLLCALQQLLLQLPSLSAQLTNQHTASLLQRQHRRRVTR
jgi:hypothetical protein